jgi:hypothetical protein
MVGNAVLLKRSISPAAVVAVCLIVAGFVGIAICNFAGPGDYSAAGIAAVFTSLTLEAVAANIEEHVLVTCCASQDEAVSITFPIGAAVALAMSLLGGELASVAHNWRALPYLIVHAVMAAVELHFVFFSIAPFGSIQTVLFTSLRKIIVTVAAMFARGVLAGMCYRLSLLTVAVGVSVNLFGLITEQKSPTTAEGFVPDALDEPQP